MLRQRSREGLFLQLTLILLLLMGGYVVTYYVFMRNQTEIQSKIFSGDTAHHVAQAGISLGVSYFTNTKQPCDLFVAAQTKGVKEINGLKESVPVRDCEPVRQLLADCGESSSLDVDLELDNFRPFYAQPSSPVGIEYGTIEKHGTLRVTARAQVGSSKRTVVVLKDVKVISSVPYVLGKFTLFAKEKLPGQALNNVLYDKNDLSAGAPKPGGKLKPIFFNHGPSADPEERGWVYLGGGVYEMNLTWGGNNWGEQFHLLQKPWKITYDPQANTALTLPQGYELLTLQRGFFDGIQKDNNLYTNFDFTAPAESPVGNGAAMLHLYGAPEANNVAPGIVESPTIVLGRVYRRYLDLKYLRELQTQKVAYLPYSSLNDWNGNAPKPWPEQPAFDVRADVVKGDYPKYYALMSKVRRESYNRGYDFSISQGDLNPQKALSDPKRVKQIANNPDFLYNGADNDGAVILNSAEGVKVFQGRLDNLDMRHQFLTERAVFTIPSARFTEFQKSGRKDIPGILHFKDGDVTIEKPLELESGGIIVVTGNIFINQAIKVKEYGRPLTLASLGGSITIGTKQRVEACLLALDGSIAKDSGTPLNVYGAMIAKNMDYVELCNSDQPGAVFYDTRLDSTAAAKDRYTVHISDIREYFMGE